MGRLAQSIRSWATSRSALDAAVFAGIILLAFLVISIFASARLASRLSDADRREVALVERVLQLKGERSDLSRKLRESTLQLGLQSSSMDAMTSRLATADAELRRLRLELEANASSDIAGRFFEELVGQINTENATRLKDLKDMESKYLSWKTSGGQKLDWLESFIARERDETVLGFGVVKGIFAKYYPDKGKDLVSPDASR